MKRFASLVLAAALLAATPAAAAPEKYEFDTVHTQIMFAVGHMGYSFSHGKFNKFTGSLNLDLEQPEKSSVEVSIDTASLDLDDQKWNDHLKTPDFFNVEKFPAMTFKSTKVEKTGDNTGKVTGDLTLLGVTKPVTLDVTLNKAAVHPFYKKNAAGFSATGTLNRSDFGMTYGLPGVADEVKIMIEVEASAATPAEEAPAAAPAEEAPKQ